MTPGSAGGELGDHGALRPPPPRGPRDFLLFRGCSASPVPQASHLFLPKKKKKKARWEEFQERQVPMFFSTSRRTAQTVAAVDPDLVLDVSAGEPADQLLWLRRRTLSWVRWRTGGNSPKLLSCFFLFLPDWNRPRGRTRWMLRPDALCKYPYEIVFCPVKIFSFKLFGE